MENDRVFYETLARTRRGMTVIDIGAHRGETALAFAARGARVYAFEPNPDIYPELARTAEAFPGIVPCNAGVLDTEGTMRLYLHENYAENPRKHSESSSFLAEKPSVSAGDHRDVPVRDIAAIVADIDRPVDNIKIDAEGAEYRILRRLIESGAIDLVREVHVEPHWDRIPGLAEDHSAMLGLIAARGLGDRIHFDWP